MLMAVANKTNDKNPFSRIVYRVSRVNLPALLSAIHHSWTTTAFQNVEIVTPSLSLSMASLWSDSLLHTSTMRVANVLVEV